MRKFTGYSGFLDIWEEEGQSGVGPSYPAASLDVADVLLHLGHRAEARDLLTEYAGRDHVGADAEGVLGLSGEELAAGVPRPRHGTIERWATKS